MWSVTKLFCCFSTLTKLYTPLIFCSLLAVLCSIFTDRFQLIDIQVHFTHYLGMCVSVNSHQGFSKQNQGASVQHNTSHTYTPACLWVLVRVMMGRQVPERRFLYVRQRPNDTMWVLDGFLGGASSWKNIVYSNSKPKNGLCNECWIHKLNISSFNLFHHRCNFIWTL